MRVILRNLGLVAAFILTMYFGSGCNEATILGNELIPGKDYVNGLDTTLTGIVAHNIWKTDSTVYTGRGNYLKVLGSIVNDPVSGSAHGIVYTQMSLPSNAFSFSGTGQTLDSIVLSIAYDGYYGDSMATQTFRVYRMSEPDFKIDSNYRYYQALKYNAGELLGTATVAPRNLKDSVPVYGVKEAPQLRIRLRTALGNEFLQQTATTGFTNDSSFYAFLKGLAIVPDTMLATNRAMLYLNLNDPATRIRVFYKNSEEDSLSASFPFKAGFTAHANYFVRNHAGSQAAPYMNTNNPDGDSLLFIEDAPGLFTKLTIPNLENFPNAVINKAELVVSEVTAGASDLNDIYSEPDYLFLQQYVAGDTTRPIIDYGNPSSPNQPYFGGERTVVTLFGGMKYIQYKFNIARYMQRLLRKQETNTSFKLEALSPRNIDVHRLKAGGGNHSRFNIKLRIIYTKL